MLVVEVVVVQEVEIQLVILNLKTLNKIFNSLKQNLLVINKKLLIWKTK